MGGHYHVTYKKPSPAMYSDYLPSGVQSERRERAYVDTGCHTYKSSRPATSSVNQSCAWSVMVTQSSSKEIWKRPWSVMATQSSNMEICKRRPRSAVFTQSSSKEDLEKKAMVSGQSVVQQGRFGKEGHGQGQSAVQKAHFQKKATMVIQSSSKDIWKMQWSVVVTQSSSKDIWKMQWTVMVTQSSSKQIWKRGSWSVKGQSSSRHISKRRPRWLFSRPAGIFGKEGHGQ